MSYCTVENVQADFKVITFTSASNVTYEDVEQFIVESDALINSYIGQRYSVPVCEDDNSLALLQLFSRTLTADRIKKIIEVKQERMTDANQAARTGFGTKEVIAQLIKIANNEQFLSGATPLVSGGGLYSNNYANDVVGVMEKDTKQW